MKPTLSSLDSQICTQSQMEEPIFLEWCEKLQITPAFHRKHWEYVYILRSLDLYGMLKKGSRGIGFGVGKEILPSYFASKDIQVMVSDAPFINPSWSKTGQYVGAKEDLIWEGRCTAEQFNRNIEYCQIDMRNLQNYNSMTVGDPRSRTGSGNSGEDKLYDFCWSTSSLEHLGSLEAGFNFLRESLKYIRRGGISVHTTEYNLDTDGGSRSASKTLDRGEVIVYRRKDLEDFCKNIVGDGHYMICNFEEGNKDMDKIVRDPLTPSPDLLIRCTLGGFVFTSFGIIIQKG